MSLDKAIEHGKEHRRWIGKKGYAKSVDTSCRNHGSCEWCKGNRLRQYLKAREKVKEE